VVCSKYRSEYLQQKVRRRGIGEKSSDEATRGDLEMERGRDETGMVRVERQDGGIKRNLAKERGSPMRGRLVCHRLAAPARDKAVS